MKTKLLKKLDTLTGYNDKLEYLNSMYLKAKTSKDEALILGMIEQLKYWGS